MKDVTRSLDISKVVSRPPLFAMFRNLSTERIFRGTVGIEAWCRSAPLPADAFGTTRKHVLNLKSVFFFSPLQSAVGSRSSGKLPQGLPLLLLLRRVCLVAERAREYRRNC